VRRAIIDPIPVHPDGAGDGKLVTTRKAIVDPIRFIRMVKKMES
jgi:hypothetical protein